jgi:hypothetical protein
MVVVRAMQDNSKVVLVIWKCTRCTNTVAPWICYGTSNMINNSHIHDKFKADGTVHDVHKQRFGTKEQWLTMYLNMLLISILSVIHQLYGNEPFYFHQHGAPPHYHRDIISYLDEILPGQWIGQRISVEYPPCSPDLTPFDFYLQGSVKDVVYCRKPLILEMLWEKM